MKAVIFIPARYASSRYPGKPLCTILGKSLIQRVYEQCLKAKSAAEVYVATDHEKIADHCRDNEMKFVYTSSDCLTGTDRVYEASLKVPCDLVINVQGDEPMVNPEDIDNVIEAAAANPSQIINGMAPITEEQEFYSVNVPKCVVDARQRLLYMSRSPIPGNKLGKFVFGHKQVCIYAFPKAALKSFYTQGGKTRLEGEEDIEILRFLEMGYGVRMVDMSAGTAAVDTPEDRVRVESLIRAQLQGEVRI